MKILAFAASNSSASINRKLLEYSARLIEEGLIPDAEVEFLDINDYEMPIYSQDRQDAGGIPPAAKDFFTRIGQADALLVSFAEHNGSYTAAYKNLHDWMSRIDMRIYQDKPTVMLATSPGGRGGASVLQTAMAGAPFFGAELRAHLSVPNFTQHADPETGALTDPDLDRQLRDALATLGQPSD